MKKQFNVTIASGSQYWYLDTEDRSDDLLAGRISTSSLYWHRPEGPAVIFADGSQAWYLNDAPCHNNKSFQQAAKLTDEEMIIMIIKYGDVK